MNSQIIIHIGMHKTATTFLQNQYFKKLQGVSLFHPWRFYDRLGTFSLEEKFLISNEGLSGVAWNDAWLRGISNSHHWITSFNLAITNLKKIHPEACIIIVFRRHGELLVSMYKQYIQEGGTLSFNKFYGEHGVIRDSDLEYAYRLKFLMNNFSKVYALSFEDFKQRNYHYFDSFFTSIGIKVVKEATPLRPINESITGSKVELLRKINKMYGKLPKNVRKGFQFIGLSPRYILQRRLSFWKPKDSVKLKEIAEVVNKKHQEDWDFITNHFWKDSKAYNEPA